MKKCIHTFLLFFVVFVTSCAFGTPLAKSFGKNYIHVRQEYNMEICNLFINACQKGKVGESGSAVIVGHNKKENKTYILSAAHVCHAGPEESEIPPFITVKIDSHDMVLFDIDGKQSVGKMVAINYTTDLCLIEAPYLNRIPVVVAKRSPKRNDYISNVGSPWGLRTHEDNEEEESKPFLFEGHFQGYLERSVEEGTVSDAIYVLDSMPGQSGSAILDANGRLIGIVSRTIPPNMKIALSPTLKQIREFLDKNMP